MTDASTRKPVLFECKKHHMRQSADGWVISFVVHPDDDVPHWFTKAKLGTPMSVTAELIDYDAREQPREKRERGLSEQCAMYCQRNDFQEWLKGRGFYARTEAETITTVRRLLCVQSRSELDRDPDAAERWKRMRTSFDYRDNPAMERGK